MPPFYVSMRVDLISGVIGDPLLKRRQQSLKVCDLVIYQVPLLFGAGYQPAQDSPSNRVSSSTYSSGSPARIIRSTISDLLTPILAACASIRSITVGVRVNVARCFDSP